MGVMPFLIPLLNQQVLEGDVPWIGAIRGWGVGVPGNRVPPYPPFLGGVEVKLK